MSAERVPFKLKLKHHPKKYFSTETCSVVQTQNKSSNVFQPKQFCGFKPRIL